MPPILSLPYHILILDDVVYNQTMGPGATLDKRRPDLRDELGYIAPPNRKLPPVPGSNYNTCDRIKRGTVISKHLNLQYTTFINASKYPLVLPSFFFVLCFWVTKRSYIFCLEIERSFILLVYWLFIYALRHLHTQCK